MKRGASQVSAGAARRVRWWVTLPRELLPGGLCPSGVSFGRVTHAPADPRALCDACDTVLYISLEAREPQSGFLDGAGLGRGGAGGVVQFLDTVVDELVVWVFFVVAVQLLDKAADMPALSSPGFVPRTRSLTRPLLSSSSTLWSMSLLCRSSTWVVQFLDTVMTCPLLCMSWFVVLKTVEVPQLQYLDKVVDVFFVQSIDGYGRPCDHAATSGLVEGASDSVHRQSQWTFQFHRDGYAFSRVWRR